MHMKMTVGKMTGCQMTAHLGEQVRFLSNEP